MHKIFLNNRCLTITSNYADCVADSNAILFILQPAVNILHILNDFISNNKLNNFYIYTNGINENETFSEISSSFKNVIAAGGLVRNTKNEVLMIYRFNHWDLPKGWHEDNETLEETALREVEEECGINGLTLGNFITKTYHIYEQNGVKILKETRWFELFYSKEEQPKPQQEEHIEDVKWIPVNSLQPFINSTYASIKEVFRIAGITTK